VAEGGEVKEKPLIKRLSTAFLASIQGSCGSEGGRVNHRNAARSFVDLLALPHLVDVHSLSFALALTRSRSLSLVVRPASHLHPQPPL